MGENTAKEGLGWYLGELVAEATTMFMKSLPNFILILQVRKWKYSQAKDLMATHITKA